MRGLQPLTIRAIRTVGVEVPMTFPLGTSRGVNAAAIERYRV